MQVISRSELSEADLCVDAIYQGSRNRNAGDDPLSALLKVSNQGGFRYRGSLERPEMVVLTSTLCEPDWPDSLDLETGVFTYFGDNKSPGRELHATPRHGNELLRRLFEAAHSGKDGRAWIPPLFIFSNSGQWRDVVFLGLAVPGTVDLRPSEDLVAIWKTARGHRFQNYRARFTILDAANISREWLNDIIHKNPETQSAPRAWKKWKETGRLTPLLSKRSIEYRTKTEQLPADETERAIVEAIAAYFQDKATDFEPCAGAIARMMMPDITSLDVTRPSRDGGRDAVGQMRIGLGSSSILVDFALEAKCYGAENSVGVRKMSRLISRLRHRQFGILVTTSYLDIYAYKEIKDDQHPIVVISSVDIAQLLRQNGYGDSTSVREWLGREFPKQ